ncbi:MAG: MOSC domain-containing protein [Bacteroidetes bacterium]|nr:MOSC domain-containing protein [Bacteroidota bacterium]
MNEYNSISDKTGNVYSINCCEKQLQKSNVKLKSPESKNSITLFKSNDKTISLLSIENIIRQKNCSRLNKKDYRFKPLEFGENITTKGIDLSTLEVGNVIKVGNEVKLEIFKIGKNCYKYCPLYIKISGCEISKEFIFCRVIIEGNINIGDRIEVL